MPKSYLGKWAMALGLGVFLVPPALGTFAAVGRPMIDRAMGENFGAFVGICVAIFVLTLSIVALVVNIRVFKQGERSWGFWVGFVPAMLVGAFWVLMVIGEFIFPH